MFYILLDNGKLRVTGGRKADGSSTNFKRKLVRDSQATESSGLQTGLLN